MQDSRPCPGCGCTLYYEYEPAEVSPDRMVAMTIRGEHRKGCSQIPVRFNCQPVTVPFSKSVE
jgi:hypothetical protein